MSPLGGEFEEEVSADRSPEHIFFRVKGSHLQTIELNRRLAKYMRLFVLRKSADAVDKRVEDLFVCRRQLANGPIAAKHASFLSLIHI